MKLQITALPQGSPGYDRPEQTHPIVLWVCGRTTASPVRAANTSGAGGGWNGAPLRGTRRGVCVRCATRRAGGPVPHRHCPNATWAALRRCSRWATNGSPTSAVLSAKAAQFPPEFSLCAVFPLVNQICRQHRPQAKMFCFEFSLEQKSWDSPPHPQSNPRPHLYWSMCLFCTLNSLGGTKSFR